MSSFAKIYQEKKLSKKRSIAVELKNRVAIITGGAKGIGEATTQKLPERLVEASAGRASAPAMEDATDER